MWHLVFQLTRNFKKFLRKDYTNIVFHNYNFRLRAKIHRVLANFRLSTTLDDIFENKKILRKNIGIRFRSEHGFRLFGNVFKKKLTSILFTLK